MYPDDQWGVCREGEWTDWPRKERELQEQLEIKHGNRESLIEHLIDVGLKVKTQNGRVLKILY